MNSDAYGISRRLFRRTVIVDARCMVHTARPIERSADHALTPVCMQATRPTQCAILPVLTKPRIRFPLRLRMQPPMVFQPATQSKRVPASAIRNTFGPRCLRSQRYVSLGRGPRLRLRLGEARNASGFASRAWAARSVDEVFWKHGAVASGRQIRGSPPERLCSAGYRHMRAMHSALTSFCGSIYFGGACAPLAFQMYACMGVLRGLCMLRGLVAFVRRRVRRLSWWVRVL